MAVSFRWLLAPPSSHRLNPACRGSVSPPRSSNRTFGFPASGFPTDFTSRHTAGDSIHGAARRHLLVCPPSPSGTDSSGESESFQVFADSSLITPSRLLPKHARSKGPFLHPVSRTSQVLFPSPTPVQASTRSAVAGRYPAPDSGLPRCPKCLPDMPSSLPRWIRSSARVGYFLVPLPPSPNLGRADIHDFPFGACSRFTRVTA